MVISAIATWFTPTVLFCVLNLTIATIFIASNFNSPHNRRHDSQGQLLRSPSLLERVRSGNLSSFYTTPESHDHYGVQSETTEFNSVGHLNRAPSLLERVKSIDLSFSSFYATPVDQSHDEHRNESEQTRHDSPSQLTRAPSLLERVKSFKLPSPFNSDHQSGDKHSDMDLDPNHDPVEDHNESRTSEVIPAKKSSSNITKSRSEKRMPVSDDKEEDVYRRRPATMKGSVGARDESVDEKADDFIKRFKQQLKLQRLDSLKRFKEMLNRGTSSG